MLVKFARAGALGTGAEPAAQHSRPGLAQHQALAAAPAGEFGRSPALHEDNLDASSAGRGTCAWQDTCGDRGYCLQPGRGRAGVGPTCRLRRILGRAPWVGHLGPDSRTWRNRWGRPRGRRRGGRARAVLGLGAGWRVLWLGQPVQFMAPPQPRPVGFGDLPAEK